MFTQARPIWVVETATAVRDRGALRSSVEEAAGLHEGARKNGTRTNRTKSLRVRLTSPQP